MSSSNVPWGSKYHLSFTIGDIYYSFNNQNHIIAKL